MELGIIALGVLAFYYFKNKYSDDNSDEPACHTQSCTADSSSGSTGRQDAPDMSSENATHDAGKRDELPETFFLMQDILKSLGCQPEKKTTCWLWLIRAKHFI